MKILIHDLGDNDVEQFVKMSDQVIRADDIEVVSCIIAFDLWLAYCINKRKAYGKHPAKSAIRLARGNATETSDFPGSISVNS